MCRFYLPPGSGDTHFYSASPIECANVRAAHPEYVLETPNAFYVLMPDQWGNCATGSVPIYRVWNGLATTNHRYTMRRDIRDQMVAQGWVAEGNGPDRVTMCAPF